MAARALPAVPAFVAAAYGGRWAGEDAAGKDAAFVWLEALEPPEIAHPAAARAKDDTPLFVPNNDVDAKGAGIANGALTLAEAVAAIRTRKLNAARRIEGDPRLLYPGPSQQASRTRAASPRSPSGSTPSAAASTRRTRAASWWERPRPTRAWTRMAARCGGPAPGAPQSRFHVPLPARSRA